MFFISRDGSAADSPTHGFTLIELAIVLVIIGLLAGGVLVGQDLIKSAGINATVSDIQSYTTGAATFRDKFGGLPGDLLSSKAQQFGLTVSATSPGTTGEGDGNGVLVNYAYTNPPKMIGLGGENLLFWRQLGDAGLIPFASTADGTTLTTTTFSTAGAAVAMMTGVIPTLRIHQGGFVHAGGVGGQNYYFLFSFAQSAGGAAGQFVIAPVFSAREANGIDQKMDDGTPDGGEVLSAAIATSADTAAPGNGGSPVTTSDTYCYDNGATPMAYAVNIDETPRCALRIRMGL